MTNETNNSLIEIINNLLKDNHSELTLDRLNEIYTNSLKESKIDITSFYEEALAHLTKKDVSSAMNYVILALDLDRKHQPTLHLCRTMLYSLGLFLVDNKLDVYKQKYKSLKLAKKSLVSKVDELKEKVKKTQDEAEHERKKLVSATPDKIKEIKNNISALENTVKIYETSLKPSKKELSMVSKLYDTEEYINILNTILQVCFLPSLFEVS